MKVNFLKNVYDYNWLEKLRKYKKKKKKKLNRHIYSDSKNLNVF